LPFPQEISRNLGFWGKVKSPKNFFSSEKFKKLESFLNIIFKSCGKGKFG
jgi:hypothetical protein